MKIRQLIRLAKGDADSAISEQIISAPHARAHCADTNMALKRVCVVLAGLMLATQAVHAGNLTIDWASIDGGGGTSTGGVFTVSGTIGQPDAGATMTNGQYSVTGGFWALPVAVQVAGAPTLAISRATTGFAMISWSPDKLGFVLQESSAVSPANWTNSPSGATNPIVVPVTLPTKLYRLRSP